MIDAAEMQLGLALPASYKTFLRVCGSGLWCGDYVAPPEDVYPFDEDCGDMQGFLALVYAKAASDVDRTWQSFRAQNKKRWQFWK